MPKLSLSQMLFGTWATPPNNPSAPAILIDNAVVKQNQLALGRQRLLDNGAIDPVQMGIDARRGNFADLADNLQAALQLVHSSITPQAMRAARGPTQGGTGKYSRWQPAMVTPSRDTRGINPPDPFTVPEGTTFAGPPWIMRGAPPALGNIPPQGGPRPGMPPGNTDPFGFSQANALPGTEPASPQSPAQPSWLEVFSDPKPYGQLWPRDPAGMGPQMRRTAGAQDFSRAQLRDAAEANPALPPDPSAPFIAPGARAASQREAVRQFLLHPPPGLDPELQQQLTADYSPLLEAPAAYKQFPTPPTFTPRRARGDSPADIKAAFRTATPPYRDILSAVQAGGSQDEPAQPMTVADRLSSLAWANENLPAPTSNKSLDKRARYPWEPRSTQGTAGQFTGSETYQGVDKQTGRFNPELPTADASAEDQQYARGQRIASWSKTIPASPAEDTQLPVTGPTIFTQDSQRGTLTAHTALPIRLPDGSSVQDAAFLPPDFDWKTAANLDAPLPPDRAAHLVQSVDWPAALARFRAAPRSGAVAKALNQQGITTADRAKVQQALAAGQLPLDVPARVLLETLNAIQPRFGRQAFQALGYTGGYGVHNFPLATRTKTTQPPTGRTYFRTFQP